MERDRELGRIGGGIAAACDGSGSTLLIEGVPGIGKTSLLSHARSLAADAGMNVMHARASELEREIAFAVVRDALVPWLGGCGPAALDALLDGAARLAGPPLGLAAETTAPSEGAALHGLCWLCANIAEQAPVLLAIDDVHWADDASLRFLAYLGRRAGDHALLLCAASRSELDGRRVALRAAVDETWSEVLRPQPLSDEGVAELVRATFDHEPEAEFNAACARASGGNPFLLVEALDELRAAGAAPSAEQAARLDGLRPEALGRALLTRVARRGEVPTLVARSVAILGADANLRRVATLARIELEQAAAAIEELRRDGVLGFDDPLDFAHPLVRTAVHEDIAGPTRGVDHLRVARLLHEEGESAERVTSHLLVAEAAGDPWVPGQLVEVAKEALARGAPESAIALLERALEEPPADQDRPVIHHHLGAARARAGRLEAAAQALAEALELTDGPAARGALALELGQVLRLSGQGPEAMQVLERALGELGVEDRDLRIALEAEIGIVDHMLLAGPVKLDRLARAAEEASGSTPNDRAMRAFYGYVATGSGALPAAEAIEVARSAGPVEGEGDSPFVFQLTAATLAMCGALREARDLLDRALDQARRAGDATQFVFVSMSRSFIGLRAGNLRDAEADARTALTEASEGPFAPEYTVAMVALALIEAGRIDGDIGAVRRSRRRRGSGARRTAHGGVLQRSRAAAPLPGPAR